MKRFLSQLSRRALSSAEPKHIGASPTGLPRKHHSALRPLALEQRFMFDGAAIAIATGDAANATPDAPIVALPDVPAAVEVRAAEPSKDNGRKEVVVVDTSVADYKTLEAGIAEGIGIIEIDGSKDGLAQLAEWAATQSGYDSISILSHGSEATLHLGSARITASSLADTAVQAQLVTLGRALTADGDLLLYGCDIGRSESGAELVEQLATLTQADIAASSDRTGAAAMGGDWVLELRSGEIAAHDVLDMAQLANYDNLLALPSATQPFSDLYWSNNTGGNTVDGFNITESTGASRANSPDSIYFSSSSVKDGDNNYYYELTWTADNVDLGTFDLDGMVIQSFGGNYRLDFSAISGGIAVSESFTYSTAQGPLTVNLDASKFNDISSFTLRVTNLSGASSVANMDLQQLILADLKTANTAPVLGNINGDSVNWAGVSSSVTMDVGSNASLSDAELGALNGGNGNWAGASLVIQRNGAAVGSDALDFNTVGALFTVSGNNLQSSGQTFATFTNTGGVLTINFTSSGTTATTALVNDVLQRITYRSDTPAGDANIRYTLNDGNGGSTIANVTVASDTIYVTNTGDTATIDPSNGVSFSEAIAIAAADNTGSQTIVFASNLAGQSLTLNSVSINESLTFDMDQASGLVLTGGTITLAGGTTQTFTHGSGDSATISSVIAGSGALNKAGAGNLTLSGTGNTFSGGTSISAGTLTTSGSSALADNGSLNVSSGATLALSSSETIGNLSGAGSISLGSSTLTTLQTADTTFSGNISGTGGLNINQNGSATYSTTLSGTNTYTGTTILLNYGWLKLNGDVSMSDNGAVRVNGNSVLTLLSNQTIGSLASNNINASIQLGSYTLTSGGDNTSTSVSGVVSGTGSLIKQGSGTLTLNGSNTYGGTTTVSAGTLSIAGDGSLGSGDLTLAGSTLQITGTSTVDNSIAITGNSTISNTNAVTLSGVISGAYALTKAGAGTLTLAGNNSYAQTFINAGTLSVSSDANLGSGSVTLGSGTTLQISDATTIDNAITLTGNATVNNSAAATLSGMVNGAFTLTKAGASNLTLSGSNSYGATTVSAGTLSVASDANLGSDTLTLAGGSTLEVTNATTIDNAIALSGNATVSTGADTTLSGVISGSNNLTKTGAATLTLSGSNTYSGTTSLNAGTLSIASDANLGSGALNLATGSTLLITGNTTIDNALVLTGVATVNAGAAATLSGVISGSGGLSKAGAGSLTLTASNTNMGSNTVSAGTLVVNGSTNSATNVASGATLAGSGTLGGDVTVQNGATLSPGNAGAGNLTISGNLTLDAGSTLALDINGATAGTSYDRIVVNGAVDVSGATLSVNHGYAAGIGETYAVIVNDMSDAITGTFSGTNEGSKFNALGNGTELTASYIGGTGNDFTLTAPIAPIVTSVSSSSNDATYKIGDTITITVQFDSVVNITGTPTLTLETGSTDRVLDYVSGSGSDTLSFSYTVQAGDISADLDYISTSALSLNGGTIKDASNQSALLALPTPGAAGSLGANKALVVDGVRPAATSITLSDTAMRIGETATVTITFNEAVLGLDVGDFNVANGTLTSPISSDGGLTWTAIFTPSTNITDASNVITLNNAGVMDQAGNLGSGTTDSGNYAIDTQRPTATIVVSDTALAAGETATVTITFSEAVTGLTIADFMVANGSLSNLSTSDNITYTATLTPSANVTDASNLTTLNNAGVQDTAGNAGTGSTDSNNYAIDTQRPTATIVVADTVLKAGQSTTVTITFNEAVTGLTPADFSVANGSLSGLSSSDGGITWTATLTPNDSITDASNLLTLDNSGYTDAAGNTGTGTTDSNNYAMDTQRPTASIVVADSELSIGETTTVTITFSEVVVGLTIADFSVENGTLSNLSTSDNITYTATLTPSANVSDGSNLITLDNTGVQNAAGNTGMGTTPSNNYAVNSVPPDSTPPTASIVMADTELTAGEVSLVTITFSEAVSGFDNSDLTVEGGTLSAVSSNDGDVTWTATFTPTANLTDTTNVITLNNAGVTDLAGNAGTGTTPSNNYAVVTVPVPQNSNAVIAPTPTVASDSAPAPLSESSPVESASIPDSSSLHSFLPAASEVGLPSGGLGAVSWSASPPTESGYGSMSLPAAPGDLPVGLARSPGSQSEALAVSRGVPDLVVDGAETVEAQIPVDAFAHTDPFAGVQYALSLANGQALPAWVAFDPSTGKLKITPPPGFEGVLELEVTARDEQGNEAKVAFRVVVGRNGLVERPAPAGRAGLSEQFRLATRSPYVTDRLAALARVGDAYLVRRA